MDPNTNIFKIFSNNIISVPDYQRAYSWDTATDSSSAQHQVNDFVNDLKDYLESGNNPEKTPYHLGHFLFKQSGLGKNKFEVIDGQQRLTTVVIFCAALFRQIESKHIEIDNEIRSFQKNILKQNNQYKFKTVDYDNGFFIDCVIDGTKIMPQSESIKKLDTLSQQRIANAYNFFTKFLSDETDNNLIKLVDIIARAKCSTYVVEDESDAVQMFIFENNRGKRPTDLEIIKAQFMYQIHLHSENIEDDLKEIAEHFKKIYQVIAHIEANISEDDILLYTLKVYKNDLRLQGARNSINEELKVQDPLPFIKNFTSLLQDSFTNLNEFYSQHRDSTDCFYAHALAHLNKRAIALPFLLKAYRFSLSNEKIKDLCKSLLTISLRDKIIGTRADLAKRLSEVFSKFTEGSTDIKEICGKIGWMCSEKVEKNEKDWWWSYWGDSKYKQALKDARNHSNTKFVLWLYEYILTKEGKNGYRCPTFNDIKDPEMEHIAPQTEKPASGYCEYDDEFKNKYLNNIGNALLLSGSHNKSLGNRPFSEKRDTYRYLRQQNEIREMTNDIDPKWGKEQIDKREDKIINAIAKNF